MINHTSGTIKNNVLIGLEKYLFLFDGGQRSFSFETGESNPSTHSILSFFENIQQRKCYLNSRNIHFLHIIFPSKEIVLQEKVPPPWQHRIQSLFENGYVTALPDLADMCLYPKELLISLSATQPIFRIFDTHMTDAGSLASTQIILKKWNFQYDASSYFIPVSEKRSSDLSKMLNIDSDNLEEFLRPTFLFHVFDNRAQLKGNTGNVCILHSPSSLTGKRLLIFGDSFIKDALPFFAPIFRDIVYIRSPNFQSDIVELIQPDFVITSNAERYLCNVTADSLSSPLLLSQYGDNNYSPTLSFKEAYIAKFSWGHHRIFYEHWVKKITANMMKWNELGLCQPNNQIESIGLDGGFRSLGVDPYFTFLKARISPEKKYVIEFDLKSDSNTLASVYFQTIVDERFTEEKTIKSTVNKGDNHLVFLLPAVKLNSIIRIDPLCCPGIFFINNVTLKEVS